MADERSQIVPFVRRPYGARANLYGTPGRLLWDEPGGKPPAPPPPPPADPQKPEGDGGGEVEKLRRETERLKAALAKRDEAESKAKAKAEAADREAAAKRGEWEKLYGEAEAKGKTLAEQLEAKSKRLEAFEMHHSERVESTLKGIEDAELRKQWKSSLEKIDDPLARSAMLDTLLATMGKAKPATPRPGHPGRSKGTIDLRELAANTPAAEKLRQDAAMALLQKRRSEKA